MRGTEEQYPLLLLLVGDRDFQKNRRFFRNRFDGITSGASAIITKWPYHINSCWATTLICFVTSLLFFLLLFSSLPQDPYSRLPRCTSSYDLDNETIHLVHNSYHWTAYQLNLLEEIGESFPKFKIHLIVIRPRRLINYNEIFKENSSEQNKLFSSLFGHFHASSRDLDEFVANHRNIAVTYTTYRAIFHNTPFYWKWTSFSGRVKNFAVRALQLWQYGGLSFDLHESKALKNSTDQENGTASNILRFIKNGSGYFEDLDAKRVSVDPNAFHMESKMACHSFFGRLLIELNQIYGYMDLKEILKKVVQMYCDIDGIRNEFCSKGKTE